jgi:glycoside/pentoside/hexuronide:cation symporter, GPH family
MRKVKLSLKEKIGYGFGDAASSMFWKLFGMYLMFFYTDIFGISAAVVGTMFLITRVGDAVFDPLVGILCDRTNTRWGKFRPYLLWMAIPFGIIGILTFTTPSLSITGKIIYAYITYMLMMIIYSMINVPYASLMGVMTSDGKERTTLATFRFIFAFGGSFLVLGLFQPLFDGFGTEKYKEFSSANNVEMKDSAGPLLDNKIFVYDNTLQIKDQKVPNDSLLFLSAKVTTKSKSSFKIGVLNSKTNEYNWFEFKEGKDTLGLTRDGIASNLQIRMGDFVPKENLAGLSDLKFVYSGPSDIKFEKISIKEIDYRSGTSKAVIVIAILAVIFFMLTFSWTRERIKPITERTSLKLDLKDLVKNGPWFILLGAGISTIFFNTIRDSAAIYYFKYYIQGQTSFTLSSLNITVALSTFYLLLGQAANIIGVILAKPVSDRIGKKNTFLIAMLIASVLSISFFWLNRTNVPLIFVFQFMISISAGIIFPLVWSMYADTADYSEWKNGRRATGLVFSAASMSQKFGAAIGMALASWLLSIYGYKANVIQTLEAQLGIRYMLSFFPALGAFLAAFFMFIYPLKDSMMRKIEDELTVIREKITH